MSLTAVRIEGDRYAVAKRQERDARKRLVAAVVEARKTHTMTEIGEAIGVTKQSVYALLRHHAKREGQT